MSNKKLQWSLLALRLSVFLVMFMWTLDKFINPSHAAAVFEKFYYISGLQSEVMLGIAICELLIIFGFVIGLKKRLTYGLVFVFHFISTASSYKQYLDPFTGTHLLFFAAIPMLAAIFALYLLREQDTLLTISH